LARAARVVPTVPPAHIMLYEQPQRPPVTTSAPSDPDAVTEPVEVFSLPPAPIDVLTSIPPVTPGPAIDAAMLRRVLSSGIPGSSPAGGDSLALHRVLAAAEVDEPAVVVHQPSPRYPSVLQQAGLEGRVLVEFIIDTAGHMETASLRVLESSNSGFDAAAGETVGRSLFPARVHGAPVRQRTVQSIVFRIAPE